MLNELIFKNSKNKTTAQSFTAVVFVRCKPLRNIIDRYIHVSITWFTDPLSELHHNDFFIIGHLLTVCDKKTQFGVLSG
jgi:hypothetical protein